MRHPHRRRTRFLAAAVAPAAATLALAAGAATAGAGLLPVPAPCDLPSSRPFLPWGDQASYVAAPDGGFEGGAAGWQLGSGAAVAAGSEPYAVGGPGGQRSLRLEAGASASSPALCFAPGSPKLRLFAVAATGTPVVHVRVAYNGVAGVLAVLDGGSFAPGQSWAPSPELALLGGNVGTLLGTTSISIRLSVSGGAAQVDDVYVDPVKQV